MGTNAELPTVQQLLWSGVAAVVFVAAASVFVIPFSEAITGPETPHTYRNAALPAAALVGAASWFVVEQYWPDRPILAGGIAGVVTGTGAHLPMWVFVWALAWGDDSGASLILPLSVMSVLFFGWVTIPLGVVGGLAVGGLRKRLRQSVDE